MQLLFAANPSIPFSCQQVSQEQLKLWFFRRVALSCAEVGLSRVTFFFLAALLRVGGSFQPFWGPGTERKQRL